ncbi:MAG TPA: hypothetical protein VEF04_06455 [Blastocatellia bacterium]|nr:hypothetical protein [Blastocatellia bacterium]
MKLQNRGLSYSLTRYALLVVLTLALNLAGNTIAQAQSAESIVKKAVKAMGGEKALRRVNVRQASGKIMCQRDGATGRYQLIAAQPNLYFVSSELSGFESSEAYNGKSGWRRDSRVGLRTLTGAESNDFQAEAVYRNNLLLNFKKEKAKLSYSGQAMVDGKSAQSVTLTTARGVKIKIYFDAASSLILKEEILAGEITKVYEYADYRHVNGLQEPFKVLLTEAGKESSEKFEIVFDQITHNQAIDRSRFDYPKVSDEALPDIQALIKQVGENAEEIDRLLDNYSYTQFVTFRRFDKNGVLKESDSEVEEVSFYSGYKIRRQISKNGNPLSAEDQAKEDKRVEKRIKEIEKELAEREKKRESKRPGEDDRRTSIADMLRSSRLINARRERFRNRDMIVFDFEPNPEYKPKKDIEKFGGKMTGTMWIDPIGKQVARVEARLIEPYKIGGGLLASLAAGSSFVIEQDRINNEIWLPTSVDINISVRALMLIGITANQSIRFSNYKRFNVETEKEKLKSPIPEAKPQ